MSDERPFGAASLRVLAEFLPKFEAPGFDFGSWDSGWFRLGNEASDFISACYEWGWVQSGFDWPEWMHTKEAERLRDDPTAIENATPEQLRRLLTLLIRQDRFVEGLVGAAFESGLLVRIVRRIATLAEVTPNH